MAIIQPRGDLAGLAAAVIEHRIHEAKIRREWHPDGRWLFEIVVGSVFDLAALALAFGFPEPKLAQNSSVLHETRGVYAGQDVRISAYVTGHRPEGAVA